MSDAATILKDIYPRINWGEALADLTPQDKGDYYLLTCPKCGKRETFFYKNGTRLICNRRDKCGFSQSLWDYVQGSQSFSNQETLLELARLADYELPALTSEALTRLDQARTRTKAWDLAIDYFRGELWSERGQGARNYLSKERGFKDEQINGGEFGLFTSAQDLTERLKAQGIDRDSTGAIYEAARSITGPRVVVAYRDEAGDVIGLIARALEKDAPSRYLYSKGLKRDVPFNLDRAKGHSKIIIVEGVFDALAVREKAGLSHVVALGGNRLAERNLNWLPWAQAFVLALDNDLAGTQGTDGAGALLRGLNRRAYVIEFPGDLKDPDAFIRQHGPEQFRELVDKAISWTRWKANQLCAKYHEAQRDNEKDEARGELIEFLLTLNPLERGEYVGELSPWGITKEELDSWLDKEREEQAQRKTIGYLQDTANALKAGKRVNLALLTEKIQALQKEQEPVQAIEPYTEEQFLEDIKRTRPGLETGYPSLDEIFRIPQEAITIIGARPSHGKTTFLMNLALNMAEKYEDRSFLFFSYEETRKQVRLKLLNILSGELIDRAFNLVHLESYLRGNNTDRPRIQSGRARLRDLTETGRLWIIGEPLFVDELGGALDALSSGRSLGAVFIDYIQKIKIKDRYPTRQVEIQKISERILEAAKRLSVPIILGAQFGRDPQHTDKVRLDNLREAGDIEQDANLVLGLFNPAMEKAQAEGGVHPGDITELRIEVLKNRNGPVNDVRKLTFNRPLLKITERG